jgi:hypothetical protein
MFSYCTDYLATMPDIKVYMNCDTRLAINLRMFDLGENDEFIFTIKNYNHIESPAVFLLKARKRDEDINGEIIFKIPSTESKKLKPGAFYNFALLVNAYDKHKETEYRKLTDNGHVIIEYGAQDMLVPEDESTGYIEGDILSGRLEPFTEKPTNNNKVENIFSEIVRARLESSKKEDT